MRLSLSTFLLILFSANLFAQMKSGTVVLSATSRQERSANEIMIKALHLALSREDTALERVVLQKLSHRLTAEERIKLLKMMRISTLKWYQPEYTVPGPDTSFSYLTKIIFRVDNAVVKQHGTVRFKSDKQPPYALRAITFPGEQKLPGQFLEYLFPPEGETPPPPPPPMPPYRSNYLSENLLLKHVDNKGQRYLTTGQDNQFCGFSWYREHQPATIEFLDAFGLPYRGSYCWQGPDSLPYPIEDLARFDQLTLQVADIRKLPQVDFAGLGITQLSLRIARNHYEGEFDLINYGGNLMGLKEFSISGTSTRSKDTPITVRGYRELQEEYGSFKHWGRIRFR